MTCLHHLVLLFFFFFYCSGDHRDLHSFPTRRSSDLRALGAVLLALGRSASPHQPAGRVLHGRRWCPAGIALPIRSEEHTSELQSQSNLVCRLLLEKKKKTTSARKSRKQKPTQRDSTQ